MKAVEKIMKTPFSKRKEQMKSFYQMMTERDEDDEMNEFNGSDTIRR